MALCPVCRGERWVCENHRDKPWNASGCECGAGAPCPACNQRARGETPSLPPDFETGTLARHREWMLPVAGGLGFALVAFILWCLWELAALFLP
jgi:hypothetical protein